MKAMIRKAPLAALVAAMSALMACDGPRRPLDLTHQGLVDGGQPPCPVDSGTCVAVSPPASLDGACTDDRWVALLSSPDSPCPPVPGASGGTWEGKKLFGEPGAPATPPALQAYCAYEWTPLTFGGGLPDTAPLKAMAGVVSSHFSELARDCWVVGPSGSSAGVDAGWHTLRDDYHQQTGWMANLPQGTTPPAKIRVAVVDTAPDFYAAGAPADDRSGHGHAVGWIIREHACPAAGASCIGQIADRLAMPQITLKKRDTVEGGYFGSQGEVARAIHGAVHDWRAFKAAGGNQPRMVINLSLGWDPKHGGDQPTPSSLPLPARAVYAAITHAVCQGALVIAAAGNDPGGPGLPGGPMFPGGWEVRPAPTPAQCQNAESPGWSAAGVFPTGAGVYQPLVYAVSGVRPDDHLLLNARPGGRARLAAPGEHAVAADGASPTQVLTGTSAGGAVTSAVAAAVWGYRPALTGPEVMEFIRGSAKHLGVSADFCLGGSPCPMGLLEREARRVNLCEAVRDACTGGPGNCPTAPVTCAPRPPYAGVPPVLSAAEMATLHAAPHTQYDASGVVYVLPGVGVCDDTNVVTTAARYTNAPCPRRQFYGTGIRPWSGPQPSSNPCPVCSIERQGVGGSYEVTMAIDDDFDTTPVGEPVLRVNGAYDVDLSFVGPMYGGDVAVVSNVDLSAVGPIETAEIQFRMIDGPEAFSTESPLIVQP
ncbi:MAG TPA: S8/S53 family peptidase [Myxococcaceae bacterium]|jgi:hypothetical protein